MQASLVKKDQRYFNRTLEDIGKRNMIRPQSVSTSKYWSKNSVRHGTNVTTKELMQIEQEKNNQAILNHRIWKINNRRKKKKKLSDFEMRLELTLQKKKLKQKELEKKYYGYNFKPKTNKKRLNIHNKKPKRKVKNTWKNNNLKKQKPNQAMVRVQKRKIKSRNVPRNDFIEPTETREVAEDYYEDFHSEDSNDIETITYYLKSKNNKPKFKRFTQKRISVDKSEKSKSEEEGEDESKLIDMEDEDDIPDQLIDHQVRRPY